jgi:hypothetical protein
VVDGSGAESQLQILPSLSSWLRVRFVVPSIEVSSEDSISFFNRLSALSLPSPYISGNVSPYVTGHPAWRDAADTPEHNKRNNGLEVHKLSE